MRRPSKEQLKPIPQWWREMLATWMAANNVTNAELARRANTSEPTIGKILDPDGRTFSSVVPRICAVTGLPPTDAAPPPPADEPERAELARVVLHELTPEQVSAVTLLTDTWRKPAK